jgi:hypothetical protein
MPDTKLSAWKQSFELATKESEPQKLKELIYRAEEALFHRYTELTGSSDHHEERRQMREATHALLEIKVNKLGYPPPD